MRQPWSGRRLRPDHGVGSDRRGARRRCGESGQIGGVERGGQRAAKRRVDAVAVGAQRGFDGVETGGIAADYYSLENLTVTRGNCALKSLVEFTGTGEDSGGKRHEKN